jgi:hypothetical protein
MIYSNKNDSPIGMHSNSTSEFNGSPLYKSFLNGTR